MTEQSSVFRETIKVSPVPSGPHACPYCAGSSAPFVASADYGRGTTDETFFYFQCSQCGLVFMDPIPGNMAPYYKGGYDRIPSSLAELHKIAAKETYRLEPVLRHKRGGSLLEIGPWRGVFCLNAKDVGFDVTAIEMDGNCVTFLNDIVGVHAIQSFDPADTLLHLNEKFDVIALWHSMEHLPSPWRVVQHAASRLKPGGLLLIAIPNIDSYEFSVMRERWRHLDAPRHLFFYPVESLLSLCKQNGLALLEATTEDHLSELLAIDSWHHWALGKMTSYGITKGYRLTKLLTRVAVLLSGFRRRKKKHSGSGITALFQLPDSR